MGFDSPDDRGPLAPIEVEHGEEGRELSPSAWIAIVLALLLGVGLLVLLL